MLAVLGVLAVLGAVAGAVGGVVVVAATRTTTVDVAEAGVREIRISGVTGGADLIADESADGTVTGTVRAVTSWQDVEVRTSREGDVLLLEADCPDHGWQRRCDVGYELRVDPDVAVVVDIVTGGLRAEGLRGDVDAAVTTGGVALLDLSSTRVGVDVAVGGVVLEFAEPPLQVDLSTTTGGISVTVPDDGAAYLVRTGVSVGESSVRVPTDPDSVRSIEASTSVGGIDIGTPGRDAPGRGPRGGAGSG